MKHLDRMTGETPLRGTAQRKLWILLSVALFALLTLGGTVSAATLAERIKPEPGVLIVAVGDGTPASEAGLQRDDILLAIDGDMVNTAAELRHVILMRDPGDTLELTVKRGDEELTLAVTLADQDGYPLLGVAANVSRDEVGLTVDRDGESVKLIVSLGAHPDDEGKAYFGVRIVPTEYFRLEKGGPDLDRQQPGGNRFGFAFPRGRFSSGEMPEGALVMAVQDEGPAAMAELQSRDLITAVDETEIGGFDELVAALANYSPGDEVNLTVDRDGETIATTVTLGAHPDDETKAYLGVSIMPLDRFRMHMQENGRQVQEEAQRGHESESDS